ncbi:DUF6542 domain-containing protein [Embleya sp. AB8]|uniref:DUF6542 domain-containing protein n=1 Tax=Embleya sp. AB8 TaxID=3156304 RepID=UPI003C753061
MPEVEGRPGSSPGARRRFPGVLVPLILVGVPVLGALVDRAFGASPGGVFAVSVVVAALCAVAMATRTGLWWVVPTPPLIVAAVTVAAGFISGKHTREGSKALATEVARWAVHAFPVMAAAEAAVAAAVVVRLVLGRRNGRSVHA